MKIKEDVVWKYENGWTTEEIASEYSTTIEAVQKLLGLYAVEEITNELHGR